MSLLGRLFGSGNSATANTAAQRNVMVIGTGTPQYVLDNQYTINTKFLRQLYSNRNNDYALSGHFVKPIINASVNFTAKPDLTSDDDDTDEWVNSLKLPYRDTHKYSEREGTVYVWPQWDTDEDRIKFEVIPIEKLQKRLIDPATKKVIGYIFSEMLTYNDESGSSVTTEITTKITADKMVRKFSNLSLEDQVIDNPFPFIPVVEFHNDKELNSDTGISEITNIEPLLKYYHDTTMGAAQAQKNDGHPKLQLSGVKDINAWIVANFGEGKLEEIKSGTSTIRMQDRDFYLNGEGEKVEYLTRTGVSGDYKYMSEIAFTNLVEGSETPELIFGANLGTSLASVKEQRPIWIKKIEAKQEQYTEPWRKVIEIARVIQQMATLKQLPGLIFMTWPIPDFSTQQEKAETFKTMVDAISKLKLDNAISNPEYHATLRKFDQLELEPDYDKHSKEVDESVKQDKERAASLEDEEISSTLKGIKDGDIEVDSTE